MCVHVNVRVRACVCIPTGGREFLSVQEFFTARSGDCFFWDLCGHYACIAGGTRVNELVPSDLENWKGVVILEGEGLIVRGEAFSSYCQASLITK